MSDPLFLGYDRTALDREYDVRARNPDHGDYLARYTRESAATRSSLRCLLDLPYGPGPAMRLDAFLATGPGAAPVQLFFHGGYWRALDKVDFSFVARGLVPGGADVVVVNYALVPTVDLDEVVRQCRASVAWVYAHAASFGADPGRIFVSGHSAGGHLVAMLLATDWAALGLPRDVIRGGCGMAGLYDLEPIRLSYLNDTLRLDEAQARRNSPLHLEPTSRVPLLLPLGALEGAEYHRQTTALAGAWGSLGVPCQVMDLPGLHHFSIVSELERPDSRLSRALLAQMGLV
jgi:arylformamidase